MGCVRVELSWDTGHQGGCPQSQVCCRCAETDSLGRRKVRWLKSRQMAAGRICWMLAGLGEVVVGTGEISDAEEVDWEKNGQKE